MIFIICLSQFVSCRFSPDIWLYTPTSLRKLTSLNLGKGRCTGWQRNVKTGGSKAPRWEPLPPASSRETTSPLCPGQWAQAWAWARGKGVAVIQLPKKLCHPCIQIKESHVSGVHLVMRLEGQHGISLPLPKWLNCSRDHSISAEFNPFSNHVLSEVFFCNITNPNLPQL